MSVTKPDKRVFIGHQIFIRILPSWRGALSLIQKGPIMMSVIVGCLATRGNGVLQILAVAAWDVQFVPYMMTK